ncbi:MAG TPA: ATP-binding protein [Allosphingosinicella sp.]|nr:ATP-binding protein [Allosphingosinicella sp.]
MARLRETKQEAAVHEVERFQAALGPFVVAAETTRMPMLFTNAAPGRPIIFANESLLALTGYSREEVLARPLDFLFAQACDPHLAAYVRASMRATPQRAVEVECRRKNGEAFPAAIYVSPVHDKAGKVVQHFLSIVDLTVHKEYALACEEVLSLQARLIHSSRVGTVGTMASTLAHEINQPLTAIANYAASARLTLTTEVDVEDLKASLKGIEASALLASAIIRRLRAMTRGEPAKRESFDLNEAVRECVTLVRAGSCAGVRIESETEGVVMIEGDRIQLQQVVVNLAKNGCEAAAELPNARVTVTTGIESGRATVTVADSGPGVDPAKATKLFTWSASAKPDGMGVGLSISREIVDAHGGDIWHDDRGTAQTRFRFAVPLPGR